ncbi:DUF397 domain-containing protein [Streptomyces sp. NBC_01795]|uniref:DUF397 domain-containing protein n=1 Tax=Streptomyces sp. NBC_01795 TaxID=2975943 RepID=UPI002DDA8CB9|nr:DUF397 domain-containing protein [Streptomyces sp. NBC_01795]WSA92572.1 DUF397 domain-containing protein [Streptomyces sp. NBC_01795]
MEWTKSTYSSNDGPQCVEVAATPGAIHIRDSKDTTVPHLTVTPATWARFLGAVSARFTV